MQASRELPGMEFAGIVPASSSDATSSTRFGALHSVGLPRERECMRTSTDPTRTDGIGRVLTELLAISAAQRRLEAEVSAMKTEVSNSVVRNVQEQLRTWLADFRMLSSTDCGCRSRKCSVASGSSDAVDNESHCGVAPGDGTSPTNAVRRSVLKVSQNPPPFCSENDGRQFAAAPSDDEMKHTSSSLWPVGVEMHDVLKQTHQPGRLQSIISLEIPERPSLMERMSSMKRTETSERETQGSRWQLVLDPDSGPGIFHGFCCFLALCHDLVLIPLLLVRNVPSVGMYSAAAWSTAAFWSVDLGMGFVTGYYRDGFLERQSMHIFWHYLKTGFAVDFFVVVLDVASLMLDSNEETTGTQRLFLRGFVFLRVAKLNRLFDRLMNRSLSDSWRSVCGGLRILFALVWMSHIISCIWIFLGRDAPTDTGGRWHDTLLSPGLDRDKHADDLYYYVSALHFSLTCLTATGVEGIGPLNTVERIFNMICLVLGLFLVAGLISALSATVTQSVMRNADETERMRQLRRYLSENQVTSKMAMRVQMQIAARINTAARKKLTFEKVFALNYLSDALRVDLRYEILAPQIMKYPLLRVCTFLDEKSVRGLCRHAVDVMYPSAGEHLFSDGEEAERVYFVIRGTVLYFKSRKCNRRSMTMFEPEGLESGEKICAGALISEVALFCKWTHCGHSVAQDGCELLVAHVKEVLKVLVASDNTRDMVLDYAKQFHSRVLAASPPQSPMPSDSSVPYTDYSEVVLSMDPTLRTMVGKVALVEIRQGTARYQGNAELCHELEKDVLEERCCIMVNADGSVERAVAVATIDVRRPFDGSMLVDLGRYRDGVLKPHCQLPGKTQEQGENPLQAVEQVVAEVRSITGPLDTIYSDREVFWKESAKYGLHTRYLRTVIHYTATRIPNVLPQPAPVVIVEKRSLEAWRNSRGLQQVEEGQTPNVTKGMSLLHHPVFKVPCVSKGGFSLYCWLPKSTFDEFSAEGQKQCIQTWLNQLDLNVPTSPRPSSVSEKAPEEAAGEAS